MEVVEPRSTLLTNAEVYGLLAAVKRDRDAKVAHAQQSGIMFTQIFVKVFWRKLEGKRIFRKK
jgi:hypothetical protein